jgi:hypothetical protein
MSWFRFLHRKHSDAQLQDEMEAFLAEETADNEARGMSRDEARRQARVKLGNLQKVRESLWMQNSPQPFTTIGREVKYAFRSLSRTPGFSIIAVLIMALCIGAATSLFTIVRSVLLRPLPFHDPGQLMMLYEFHRGAEARTQDSRYRPVAPGDFYDWREKTRGFEDMAIMRYAGYSLTGEHGEFSLSWSAQPRARGICFSSLECSRQLAGRLPTLKTSPAAPLSCWTGAYLRDVLPAMPELWAVKFTSTASLSLSSAYCPHGSPIRMPASSCGYRTKQMSRRSSCEPTVTTKVR